MTTEQMALRVDQNMAAVLDVFQTEGDATTGMLVEHTGLSRPTLSKRLDRLHAAGCIEYKHEPTALWRLIEDPRDDE